VTAVAERLRAVIEPYVTAEGVELDDLEIVGKEPGVIVRVTLDSVEPVGVDLLAALSRGLSRLLDAEDPVAGSYTLEVGSPGLERKLRRPHHYQKSLGRQVSVKTNQLIADERRHRGVLASADEEGFVLNVDGIERRISYGDVASARTVFVWEKPPKPGKR